MKKFFTYSLLLVLVIESLHGQSSFASRKAFFSDSSMMDITFVTNMSKILKTARNGTAFRANVEATLADGTNVNEPVELVVRGHMRHEYCFVPPLKVVFKSEKGSAMSFLKSLKLVNECKISAEYDQYLLKEYLCYKIYNLMTDMSFRARLVRVHFKDSAGKKKEMVFHGFLLEDIKDVAKRNGCEEFRKADVVTEATNRRQMTMVSVFEYFIGNTDWAVPVNHNTKLIYKPKDSTTRPYVIPYDFDYAGLVNTEYAVPDDRLGIETVRTRLYRGYPRTMEELNEVLAIFNQNKLKVYALINDFSLLSVSTKRDVTRYVDDFYKYDKDPRDIKDIFIKGARTD